MRVEGDGEEDDLRARDNRPIHQRGQDPDVSQPPQHHQDLWLHGADIYIILEVGTGGQLYQQLKRWPTCGRYARPSAESTRLELYIATQSLKTSCFMIQLCFYQENHQSLQFSVVGAPEKPIADRLLRHYTLHLSLYPQRQRIRRKDRYLIDQYHNVRDRGGKNPFSITWEEELIKIVKEQINMPSYLLVIAQVRDFLDRCLQNTRTSG